MHAQCTNKTCDSQYAEIRLERNRPRLPSINKLKNAYFKFKSTNRQRNEMLNIIVCTSDAHHTNRQKNKSKPKYMEQMGKNHFQKMRIKIVSNYMRKKWNCSDERRTARCVRQQQRNRTIEPSVVALDFFFLLNMHIVVSQSPGILFIVTGARNTNRLIYLPLQHKNLIKKSQKHTET